MIKLNESTIAQLGNIYVVANTPAYLFQHLKRHPAVERLGRESSIPELVAVAERVAKAPDRTWSDVTTAYAALVALSEHPWDDVWRCLQGRDLAGLDWATEMIAMVSRLPGGAAAVHIPPMPPRLATGISTSSAESTATTVGHPTTGSGSTP